MTIKKPFIFLFFFIQIVSVVYQLNREINFFNWSMYHTCIHYDAIVTIDGIRLNEQEFFKRYKIKKNGYEGRSFRHLKRKLIQREELIKDDNEVIIELNYTENTHKKVWNWKNW